jgi:hypothetical protein
MRKALVLFAALAGLLQAGCTPPPPEAYASSARGSGTESRPVGRNQRNEACVAQRAGGPVSACRSPMRKRCSAAAGRSPRRASTRCASRAIWTSSRPPGAGANGSISASSARRRSAPPSWAMSRPACWPARAAPTAPPIWASWCAAGRGRRGRRAAGHASGRRAHGDGQPAAGGDSAPVARSEAVQLAVSRLAADQVGAADEAQYDRLLLLGRDLNQTENFAGAEDVYRQALAARIAVLRSDTNPNLATPLMHIAVNLSNQRRFQEADRLFERASTMVGRLRRPHGLGPAAPVSRHARAEPGPPARGAGAARRGRGGIPGPRSRRGSWTRARSGRCSARSSSRRSIRRSWAWRRRRATAPWWPRGWASPTRPRR